MAAAAFLLLRWRRGCEGTQRLEQHNSQIAHVSVAYQILEKAFREAALHSGRKHGSTLAIVEPTRLARDRVPEGC